MFIYVFKFKIPLKVIHLNWNAECNIFSYYDLVSDNGEESFFERIAWTKWHSPNFDRVHNELNCLLAAVSYISSRIAFTLIQQFQNSIISH
jgi:hypothetical protein